MEKIYYSYFDDMPIALYFLIGLAVYLVTRHKIIEIITEYHYFYSYKHNRKLNIWHNSDYREQLIWWYSLLIATLIWFGWLAYCVCMRYYLIN